MSAWREASADLKQASARLRGAAGRMLQRSLSAALQSWRATAQGHVAALKMMRTAAVRMVHQALLPCVTHWRSLSQGFNLLRKLARSMLQWRERNALNSWREQAQGCVLLQRWRRAECTEDAGHVGVWSCSVRAPRGRACRGLPHGELGEACHARAPSTDMCTRSQTREGPIFKSTYRMLSRRS